MDDMSAVITAISGGGGVLGGSGLAYVLIKSWIAKLSQDNRDLAKEVKDLRETHIGAIDRRVSAIEQLHKDCPIATVEADLKNVIGWQKSTSLTLQDVQKTVNSLEAHREDDREWMRNISGKLDRLGEK